MIPVIMINDAPVACINQAAIMYHVPVPLILSVMKRENGRNGSASHNKNGTVDYGIMQINSLWLPKIAAFNYSKEDIQFNRNCKNIYVGTWILSQSIAEGRDVWSGVGNYHSHTPSHNRIYRNNIYKTYHKILFVLN
jgi:soluble lytic murein transglycosylase-like protein